MSILAEKKRPVLDNVSRAAELFSEYGDFIRSVIYFNIRNKDLTEDIYQDLFIHFSTKPLPPNVQNTKGFLYKVVLDKVIDSFRRMEHYNRRIHRYSDEIDNTSENPPEDKIIDIEETEKMFNLIARTLPKNEARAVIFKFKDNCDTTEIAKRMGIRSRSVSRYVSVGIKKLKNIIIVE